MPERTWGGGGGGGAVKAAGPVKGPRLPEGAYRVGMGPGVP